jgi:hypothetical protein
MTHTFAVMQISKAAYVELKRKLIEAGYEHAVTRTTKHGEVLDMSGIAVVDSSAIAAHGEKKV